MCTLFQTFGKTRFLYLLYTTSYMYCSCGWLFYVTAHVTINISFFTQEKKFKLWPIKSN